jgi:hypothetical protein
VVDGVKCPRLVSIARCNIECYLAIQPASSMHFYIIDRRSPMGCIDATLLLIIMVNNVQLGWVLSFTVVASCARQQLLISVGVTIGNKICVFMSIYW